MGRPHRAAEGGTIYHVLNRANARKTFPIQDDEHFYTVARYVERNALRANLTARAELWQWGSLYRWRRSAAEDRELLSAWPLPRRPNWVEQVNAPQTEAETEAVQRGRPFGNASWCEKTVRRLGLESTLRPHGRPKNPIIGS